MHERCQLTGANRVNMTQPGIPVAHSVLKWPGHLLAFGDTIQTRTEYAFVGVMERMKENFKILAKVR